MSKMSATPIYHTSELQEARRVAESVKVLDYGYAFALVSADTGEVLAEGLATAREVEAVAGALGLFIEYPQR